jgi:hypothetical protein
MCKASLLYLEKDGKKLYELEKTFKGDVYFKDMMLHYANRYLFKLDSEFTPI